MIKTTLRRGFTLIELLVVIAIIGILAAVVITSLNDARGNANDSSAKTSLSNIRGSAEIIYNNSNFSYDTVCDAGNDVERLIDAADEQTQTSAVCADNANAYATHTTLRSGNVFCVDSTGFSGEVAAAPAAGAVVCQ